MKIIDGTCPEFQGNMDIKTPLRKLKNVSIALSRFLLPDENTALHITSLMKFC